MPQAKHQQRHIIRLTIVTMIAVAMLTTATTIGILYQTSLAFQRERLVHIRDAVTQLVTIASQSDGEPFAHQDDKRVAAHLATLLEPLLNSRPLGRSGELLIVRHDANYSVILFSSIPGANPPLYLVGDEPLDAFVKRAMGGATGVTLERDASGRQVLAAYEPLLKHWGVVAKIDMLEVWVPFLRASGAALLLALGLVLLITLLFYYRFIKPHFQRLDDEQNRYRALVELSPYGLLVIDAKRGNIVTFNRVAHEQLGYTAAEFNKLHIPDFEVIESPEQVQEHIHKVLKQGQDDFDTLHRTKDGELRNVHVHVKTFNFGGRLSFHTIFRDITEQKAVQTELEQYRDHLQELVEERNLELLTTNQHLEREIAERIAAEEQLQLADIVYRNTLEGVFVTDAEGTILTVNPAFTTITGYSGSEVIGKNPRLLKSHHQPAEFYEQLWEILLAEGQWSGELWNRRKNGEAYLQQLTITMSRGSDGKPRHYVSVFSDITALREQEERIRHQAYHDALTGLPNRNLFLDRLTQALLRAERSDQPLAIMFLDLDRFKVINDTLGHHIGDDLLCAVAQRLSALLRHSDTISRLGGDEFVILLSELEGPHAAREVAEKIIELFASPFAIDTHELVVSTSIGIALFPEDGGDATTLMKNADVAMYDAKESGRNLFKFYRADMNAHAAHQLAIEHHLRKALENGVLEVHYQPRVDLEHGGIIAVEALLRWNDPLQGMISPCDFIPVAEESGLIVPLGEWVLESACRQAREWHAMGHTLRISVNISARQFNDASLINSIAKTLRNCGLPASCLELELTESLIMRHAEQTIETLRQLKQLGVWIAVDDFGTGYSSLSYLKRFPIDVLKIDKSFIDDIASDSNDAAIVETIIALGKGLQIEVLAEGVETAEQLDFLQQRGCHTIQGFYFSKPLPAEQLTPLLGQKQRLER